MKNITDPICLMSLSQVNYYSLNDCPRKCNEKNFIIKLVLQLYSEGKKCNLLSFLWHEHFHRRNERVGAKAKNELHAAQDNLTKLLKTWTNVRKSPKAKYLPRKASPGAFKCLLFSIICNLCCNLFICAFKFSRVEWNHRCMILGTHVLNTRG